MPKPLTDFDIEVLKRLPAVHAEPAIVMRNEELASCRKLARRKLATAHGGQCYTKSLAGVQWLREQKGKGP